MGPAPVGGGVRPDRAGRRAGHGDEEVILPNKAFRIPAYPMRRPNRVPTRTMLAAHVRDDDVPNATNVIAVHVRQLRRRLDDPYPGRPIRTVRGAGYRFCPDR